MVYLKTKSKWAVAEDLVYGIVVDGRLVLLGVVSGGWVCYGPDVR